jgi:hypothetical protein
MSDTHDAVVYLQIEPSFYSWGDPPKLAGISGVRMTQKRPRQQRAGTALVKLTIRIPDAAFMPLRPEAVVEVGSDLVSIEPVVVEAGDPE